MHAWSSVSKQVITNWCALKYADYQTHPLTQKTLYLPDTFEILFHNGDLISTSIGGNHSQTGFLNFDSGLMNE